MDSKTLSLFTDNNLIQFVVIPVLITLIFLIVLYLFSFKQNSDIKTTKSNKSQQNKSGTTNKKKIAEKSDTKQQKHVKETHADTNNYFVAKNDIPLKTENAAKSVTKLKQTAVKQTKLIGSSEKLLKSKTNVEKRLNTKNQKISNETTKKLATIEKPIKKTKSNDGDGWQVVQSKTDKKSIGKKTIKETTSSKIEMIQTNLPVATNLNKTASANLKSDSSNLKNQKQFKNELNRIEKTKGKIDNQLKSLDPTIQLVEDIKNTTITINSDNGSTFEMPKHITKDELEKIVKQISSEATSKGSADKTVIKIMNKNSNLLNDNVDSQFGANLLLLNENALRQEAEHVLDDGKFSTNYSGSQNGDIVKKTRNRIGEKIEEKFDTGSNNNVVFDEMADLWITAKPQRKKH